VNRKAALIEKLEQLDTGFESLYDKVKEELESNRDIHKEQIRQMQEPEPMQEAPDSIRTKMNMQY